jgi:acyl-CoA hydrolase
MEPIRVGNLVQCQGELTYVGRTSMEVRVEVYSENPLTGASRLTNVAYLVYVALDAHGSPAPVPELVYETADEQRRADQARERQRYRKEQRERENT